MTESDKPIVWLHNAVKTPPFTKDARLVAGYYLRMLQKGIGLPMPHSKPMSSIGVRCHELRINDEEVTWRIIYRIDKDAIIILEVFSKKTGQTPKKVIEVCKKRLSLYDS